MPGSRDEFQRGTTACRYRYLLGNFMQDAIMADSTNSGSGATPWLAFLVGGLLVAVAALGFLMFKGGHFGAPQVANPTHLNVTVKEPGKH